MMSGYSDPQEAPALPPGLPHFTSLFPHPAGRRSIHNVDLVATSKRLHLAGCGVARGAAPVDPQTLEDLRVAPCRRCFPDFPQRRVHHRRCLECQHDYPKPCGHNGGVMVKIPSVRTKGKRANSGGTYLRQMWVWPENAYLYQ